MASFRRELLGGTGGRELLGPRSSLPAPGGVAPREEDVRAATARPGPARPDLGLDLVLLFYLLRRRLGLVIVLTLLLTMAAAALVSQLPSRYTADALLVLNVRQSRLAELQSPTDTLLSRSQSDASVVRTEMEVLTSAHLLEQVVHRLDLLNDPVFNPPRDDDGMLARVREAVAAALARMTGRDATAEAAETRPDAPAAEQPELGRALDRLRQAIAVVNEGGAYSLRVQVETTDPLLSARIANSLAEVYLAEQEGEKERARSVASAWLGERLKQLHAAVLGSDEALARFRAGHQLGQSQGQSILDARMAEINSAIVAAQTRYSRAQADLEAAEQAYGEGRVGNTLHVLASPTIQAMREQEAQIQVRISELGRELGARHPRRLEAQAQLNAVRAEIRQEVERILASMRSEANAARADLEALEARLVALEERRGVQAQAEVGLADLEREARANREVYDEFLRQFNTVVAQEAGQAPDARLADPARPPLEPSAPRRKLLLAGAGIASLLFSTFIALVIGWWRGGIATAAELEQATGLPTLGTIAELRRPELVQLLTSRAAPVAASSIRALALALDARFRRNAEASVVLITSALQGEGKSMLSLTLARALTLFGRRVLLVDLDLWRPTLGRLVTGLSLEPTRRSRPGAALYRDPHTRLELAVPTGSCSPEELPDTLREVLDAVAELRTDFDLILLDAAPVLPTPEVLLAAREADATMLVVRFESTGVVPVRLALDKLAAVGVVPAGTVLTRVDRRNYRRYGYGELSYTRTA
ncbi:MAG TPA: polysaccharide biosynthesis tyrosine autokinase [Geminicoccaceae bacterium]|nr:polysaccharide biosynthesis tyrosine autokinase [Geminicoccaceae bacterium]